MPSKTVPIEGHVVTQKEKQLLREENPVEKAHMPVIKPMKLIKVLCNELGCSQRRQKGSHRTLVNAEGTGYASVPIHNKPLRPEIVKNILKGLNLDTEEARKVIEESG